MQPDSFGVFFKLKNGPLIFKLIAVAVVVIAFGLYKGYDDNIIDDTQLIAISVGIVLAIDLVFFVMFMLPFLAYKRMLQTVSPLSEDWKHFISQRSKEFLSANRYVSVSLSVQATPKATSDHRELIHQFLSRWQQEGESIHTGIGKKRSPDNFKIAHQTISGHVAVAGGMNLLLRKIFSELPALLKAVENHADVVLRFGNETNFERDVSPDRRDDAYQKEMNRKRNDR